MVSDSSHGGTADCNETLQCTEKLPHDPIYMSCTVKDNSNCIRLSCKRTALQCELRIIFDILHDIVYIYVYKKEKRETNVHPNNGN